MTEPSTPPSEPIQDWAKFLTGIDYELVCGAPADIPAGDRAAFESLVRKGREVNRQTLPSLMQGALALALVRKDAAVVAVAGLKRPHAAYRSKVFAKAKVLDPGRYPYELGWAFVEEEHRGARLGRALVESLCEKLGEARAYATSLDDNERMHAALMKAGFVRVGEPYPSTRPKKKLIMS
jgi:predicted GNAT family N-acyltransferase